MKYKSLKECVEDLERHGFLIRISEEVDPYLEMAEIHRRVFQAEGPALLFENVKGSPFSAVSNLFGTLDRSRFIFRSTIDRVKKLMQLKADPSLFLKAPRQYAGAPLVLPNLLPKKVGNAPIFYGKTSMQHLPQIVSWPDDGGPFILLPQVYTEDPYTPGILKSNIGMYRIQMAGNEYQTDREVGLHYQIRRDIGVHHSHAIKKGEPLRVSVFVGGPPSHTFAAVMPLPEGMSEVTFAGALGGRRFRYSRKNGHVYSADADFCITGTVIPHHTLPEGPFGDHLGYYSLQHNYPVLQVDSVYHRRGAIWPFTVVGRPPQEDTSFGKLIQEIVEPLSPVEMPGLKALHAVDASGVHPLMLAIGKERYTPYNDSDRPQEILKVANAILGYGHPSISKYLFIVATEDNPHLDIHNIQQYFSHVLERVDWRRDLHFQTETTIDSLDYTGSGLNEGSKVIIAARGKQKRNLASTVPGNLPLMEGFNDPRIVFPGIMTLRSPAFKDQEASVREIEQLSINLASSNELDQIPLIVLTEDSEFVSRNLNNFLWVTFTRSNPSHDIHGVRSFVKNKHWGCAGPLIIDARLKPQHAPPLVEDQKITQRVNEMGRTGGCLHGIV